MINKQERDKSLDFLENFINSYNHLSDEDINSLFDTYKNDQVNGFVAGINNDYDFIINNLNETVDLFLKSHCNVRLLNFKNIEDAGDSFSDNSVCCLLYFKSLSALGVPVVGQWLTNLARNHEVVGSIPGLAQGLRIRHCCELWCRLQMWLRPCVAVALA